MTSKFAKATSQFLAHAFLNFFYDKGEGTLGELSEMLKTEHQITYAHSSFSVPHTMPNRAILFLLQIGAIKKQPKQERQPGGPINYIWANGHIEPLTKLIEEWDGKTLLPKPKPQPHSIVTKVKPQQEATIRVDLAPSYDPVPKPRDLPTAPDIATELRKRMAQKKWSGHFVDEAALYLFEQITELVPNILNGQKLEPKPEPIIQPLEKKKWTVMMTIDTDQDNIFRMTTDFFRRYDCVVESLSYEGK